MPATDIIHFRGAFLLPVCDGMVPSASGLMESRPDWSEVTCPDCLSRRREERECVECGAASLPEDLHKGTCSRCALAAHDRARRTVAHDAGGTGDVLAVAGAVGVVADPESRFTVVPAPRSWCWLVVAPGGRAAAVFSTLVGAVRAAGVLNHAPQRASELWWCDPVTGRHAPAPVVGGAS